MLENKETKLWSNRIVYEIGEHVELELVVSCLDLFLIKHLLLLLSEKSI